MPRQLPTLLPTSMLYPGRVCCGRSSALSFPIIASCPVAVPIRAFASQEITTGNNPPLVNERLVAALVNQSRTRADALQVRLIMPKDVEQETKSKIVFLSEAIQLSLEHKKDLIGISIEQEVPVVKVECLKKLAYQAKKAKKKVINLPEKEFRFKSGIADNDLQRKVNSAIQSLDKGHNCVVSIRFRSYEDPANVQLFAAQILERLEKAGELTSKPVMSEGIRVLQYRLRPCSRKKS